MTIATDRAWPEPPAADSGVADRLAWYAAVARWAPSKHNTQPWQFVVRGSVLEVQADPSRTLPVTDPRRRELLISCGAAVHLATTAAHAVGRRATVTLLPQGDGPVLATVVEDGPWSTSETDRELLAAAARRRTDRGPLDAGALPPPLTGRLTQVAHEEGGSLRWVETPGDRATLAQLVARADRLLVRRPEVDAELADWLREPGAGAADGVPADHTRGAAESYRAEFVQRDFSRPGSLPLPQRALLDRPWVVVLCTPWDRPVDWLVAGRALSAVLLHARVAGADASYLNQPVEEPAVRVELQDQLRLPGAAQLVLRLGVGSSPPAPGRRPVEEVTSYGGDDPDEGTAG